HQSGGGTGFSFSHLRPKGDIVKSTGGVASGPVSFMKVFDAATEQIKQGGRRRGANMGALDVEHPDIERFIKVKKEEEALRNFNTSVATTGEFWDAYRSGEKYGLVNPRTGGVEEQEDPERILELMAESAWESGDPGVLFLDRINEDNPFPVEGPGDEHWIGSTNPCGEVPLEPYEPCILGSVNLGHHTRQGEVDWEKLEDTVRTGIRLLDNAVEMSVFPLDAIREKAEANRKIGLGVMGFHDMLVDLEIPYHSEEAVEFASELMEFISEKAFEASKGLAEERGAFPNWEESVYEEEVRNATRTTIAPTG
ncbi:MAG: adenosylcobalamin-dependent ribonucleoside-diphosphate reductase, partial [Candidatus Nanohaloarchaea archaeon]|nr:adenosylcobalamin-dependent ribonucleoside-diphosphate reductase [Candidatus Nanohaloarchaea archaeon]